MISEEQLQAIKDEATEKYPLLAFWEEDTEKQRKAYIAGATNEALKNESNAVGFIVWLAQHEAELCVTGTCYIKLDGVVQYMEIKHAYSLYIKQIKQ